MRANAIVGTVSRMVRKSTRFTVVVYRKKLRGGRCRNRTYTNGFGDRCSTTKLIARREQKSPRRGYYALLFDFLKDDALSELLVVLLKLYLVTCKFLLVFTCIDHRAGRRLKLEQIIL